MSIYNEGDISENFYIVKSGEFQVIFMIKENKIFWKKVFKKFKIKQKNNEKNKVAKLEVG